VQIVPLPLEDGVRPDIYAQVQVPSRPSTHPAPFTGDPDARACLHARWYLYVQATPIYAQQPFPALECFFQRDFYFVLHIPLPNRNPGESACLRATHVAKNLFKEV